MTAQGKGPQGRSTSMADAPSVRGPAQGETGEYLSHVDPELAGAAALMVNTPSTEDMEGMRRHVRATIAGLALPREDSRVATADRLVPGPPGGPQVPVRVYTPTTRARPTPALLYLHGGGFIAGDLDTGHAQCLAYAAQVRCVVVSVDYRLAPEHPYPAAVEDCYAVLQWLATNADSDVDPARLAVAGDSAGGTLTAALALMTRDRGGPALALQMIQHAPLDDQTHLKQAWRLYLGDQRGEVPAYAAPARAHDLSGLAPAYLGYGALEGFRDEGIAYAGRLLDACVPTELHVFARAPHSFGLLAPNSTLGQHATEEYHRVLRAAFAG